MDYRRTVVMFRMCTYDHFVNMRTEQFINVNLLSSYLEASLWEQSKIPYEFMHVIHSNTDERRWGKCSMCTCISQMTFICLLIQQRTLSTDLSLGEMVRRTHNGHT